MKEQLLEYIICPKCKSSFDLNNEIMQGKDIVEGQLKCKNNHFFPIEKGIPRLIEQNLDKNQDQTSESFGFKWQRISKFFEKQTIKFRREWYLKKYRWKTEEKLKDFLRSKSYILDVGCGLGRDLDFYANNTKGLVFGVDISRAIDVAYDYVGHNSKVHLIQADIMNLPFNQVLFNFIVAEGVLHHTFSSKEAFDHLVQHLAKNGQIAIYIYKKKGPIREFCDDYIRFQTTSLSVEECLEVARKFTDFGKALSDLNIEIEIPKDIIHLNIERGTYNLQRFIYWNIFKCFWNENLPYEVNVMTNFDWYHPKYAWRHTPDEVKKWFEEEKLEIISFDVSKSGISARGKKAKGK